MQAAHCCAGDLYMVAQKGVMSRYRYSRAFACAKGLTASSMGTRGLPYYGCEARRENGRRREMLSARVLRETCDLADCVRTAEWNDSFGDSEVLI